jgi:hypothetical protein
MIWDVISDENIFKFLSRDIQLKISEVFTNNLKGFYENEVLKKNTSLIDLNKKYIILMLSFIKQNYPQQPNKITILEEISPTNQQNLITYEEIHSDRKSQFDKELSKRQEEFTSAMTLKVPPVPDFNDKHDNMPITEMEKIIKEMTAQRNYDVEEINRGFNSQIQDDNWLKPQETSIKNEKLQSPFSQSQGQDTNINTNTKLKYFKVENDEITFNKLEQKRNVTWGENITKEFEENEIVNNDKLVEENIFKKLKRVETKPLETKALEPKALEPKSDNNEEIKKTIIDVTNRLSEIQEEMKKMQDFLKNLSSKITT